MPDYHELPKLADSLSYLYAEHCIVDKNQQAIELYDQSGATLVPTAALTALLLGPGTRITHAAIKVLGDSGCTVVWVGEDGTRCYAHGGGETRRAYHLLHQARLASDDSTRLEVCKRMYQLRFKESDLSDMLSIEQLRGMEGARVRTAYTQASLRHNVRWHGRSYDRHTWDNSDPINRALSAANALLNGLCHAAIVSGGYSPALGFIHTGLQRSFVYDIADLYKVDFTIPIAFSETAKGIQRLEARVREACRDEFRKGKLLKRILPDIQHVLDLPDEVYLKALEADADRGRPEPLWEPDPELEREPTAVEVASDNSETPDLPFTLAESLVPHPHGPAFVSHTLRNETTSALRNRLQRAEHGINSNWEVREINADTWHVTTSPNSDGYTIIRQEGKLYCTCPDFTSRAFSACKHTFAVELTGHAVNAGVYILIDLDRLD